MKLSRPALLVTLLLAASGCAALAELGGLEVCIRAPAQAAPSASAPVAP